MSRTFALIDGGVVTNVILAPADYPSGIDITDIEPRPSIGWLYDGTAFTSGTAVAPATPTSPRMTHLYFLQRFTMQERAAVRLAATSDPVLDDAMFLFNSARDIDVSLLMTQQLVGYMAATGLIAPERVPELLAEAPVTENGVYA
jgi:hypothetical protein